MKRFSWMAYDSGNCDLFQHPQEIEAKDFGHALQKIAAQIPEDVASISVYDLSEVNPEE